MQSWKLMNSDCCLVIGIAALRALGWLEPLSLWRGGDAAYDHSVRKYARPMGNRKWPQLRFYGYFCLTWYELEAVSLKPSSPPLQSSKMIRNNLGHLVTYQIWTRFIIYEITQYNKEMPQLSSQTKALSNIRYKRSSFN